MLIYPQWDVAPENFEFPSDGKRLMLSSNFLGKKIPDIRVSVCNDNVTILRFLRLAAAGLVATRAAIS
jgi:hypothetical protein